MPPPLTPRRDVADVVVGGADQLAEHRAVAAQRAARRRSRAGCTGRRAGRSGWPPGRSTACAPHGPSAPSALAVGVEVELVGVVDQPHGDGQVVVVDLVDPVDQRDLLGQHVLGAEVGGVRRVAGQREAVDLLDDLGCPLAADLAARERAVDRRGSRARRTAGRRSASTAARVVAQVRGGAARVVRGVDEPRALAVGAAHRGVEAHRRDVEGDRGARVVERAARPGAIRGGPRPARTPWPGCAGRRTARTRPSASARGRPAGRPTAGDRRVAQRGRDPGDVDLHGGVLGRA